MLVDTLLVTEVAFGVISIAFEFGDPHAWDLRGSLRTTARVRDA